MQIRFKILKRRRIPKPFRGRVLQRHLDRLPQKSVRNTGYPMEDDTFKIFVYRLRDGYQEKIQEALSPEFLDIHEKDLAFTAPVRLVGSASFSDEMLMIALSIETEVTMPCAICNEKCQVKMSIPNFCYTVPLPDIKGSVFDYREALREGILLELPYTTECNGGNCPERGGLAKYLTNVRGSPL